jgi:hypothetical protein
VTALVPFDPEAIVLSGNRVGDWVMHFGR